MRAEPLQSRASMASSDRATGSQYDSQQVAGGKRIPHRQLEGKAEVVSMAPATGAIHHSTMPCHASVNGTAAMRLLISTRYQSGK